MTAANGADIYAALLAAIEDGELGPGARLRETDLAARFGVSRTPIREGLKRLEAQGLAAYRPNRGMVVPSLDHDQITELYVVREVLEGTVARLAAQHASAAEVAVLEEMVERDRDSADDPRALLRANRLFHHRLTMAAHNPFLVAQIDRLRLSQLLLDGTTFEDESRRRAAIDEHQAIVAAIGDRDFDRAEAAARRHMHEAHKARLRRG